MSLLKLKMLESLLIVGMFVFQLKTVLCKVTPETRMVYCVLHAVDPQTKPIGSYHLPCEWTCKKCVSDYPDASTHNACR